MSIKFSCVTLRHMSFRPGDLPLYLGVSECREQPSVGGVAGFQIALHGVEGLAVQVVDQAIADQREDAADQVHRRGQVAHVQRHRGGLVGAQRGVVAQPGGQHDAQRGADALPCLYYTSAPGAG